MSYLHSARIKAFHGCVLHCISVHDFRLMWLERDLGVTWATEAAARTATGTAIIGVATGAATGTATLTAPMTASATGLNQRRE